jgi:hypothetical protein
LQASASSPRRVSTGATPSGVTPCMTPTRTTAATSRKACSVRWLSGHEAALTIDRAART